MRRLTTCSLVALALTATALAQDGPLNRAGRALDNAGKNIRARVETEVARGRVVATERDLLGRVIRRIEWDKQLVGSALQFEAQTDGTIILRGTVPTETAKRRAVDLAESTIGVTKVVDATAVPKDVQVIEAPAETKIIVPEGSKIVVPAEPRKIDTP